MSRWIRWLAAPAALAVVLVLASAQSAEAHRWAYRYGGYGHGYGGCYTPYRTHYVVPRVHVYRAPVVVPGAVVHPYAPYRAYYAPRPYVHLHVW